MLKVILSRLLQSLLVLFLLYTVTFFLTQAMPGNALSQEKALPPYIRAKIEESMGLKQSPLVQYRKGLVNFATGNPGNSFRLQGKPVAEILAQAFPVSFQLGVVAMVFAVTVGIPAGCLAAAKKNGLLDSSSMLVAMIGICLPSFVSGPILAEIFARHWNLFPATGWSTASPSTWVLPAVTLGLGYAAYISRLTRAGMLETLSQDFVRTARAKGVKGSVIVIRHCLRGGLIPAVAFIGPAFAGIISGSLVIETVFQLPGLGRHFIKAIETRDVPVVLALTVIYGALVIGANFLTDVVAIWLNPRLRKSS